MTKTRRSSWQLKEERPVYSEHMLGVLTADMGFRNHLLPRSIALAKIRLSAPGSVTLITNSR
jgi:hypothetical protein